VSARQGEAAATSSAAYLLGLLDRISALPRHPLLHSQECRSISHALGLDGYIGFFARRLYWFEGLCDVSAVLLVFLIITHAPSYSGLQTEAMRRHPLRIARFRAVAASSVPATQCGLPSAAIGTPTFAATICRTVGTALLIARSIT
jgi:hypothetical protein